MNEAKAIGRLRLIMASHIIFVLLGLAYYIYATLNVEASVSSYYQTVNTPPNLTNYLGYIASLYFLPAILIGIIIPASLRRRIKRSKSVERRTLKNLIIFLLVGALVVTLLSKVVMDFGRVDCGNSCVASVPSYTTYTLIAIATGLVWLVVTYWVYWALSPITEPKK